MAQQMPRIYWLHHSLVSGASLKASLQRSPILGPLSKKSKTEASWAHNIFPLCTSTIYFIVFKKPYSSPTSCINNYITSWGVSHLKYKMYVQTKHSRNCLWAMHSPEQFYFWVYQDQGVLDEILYHSQSPWTSCLVCPQSLCLFFQRRGYQATKITVS